MDDVFENCARTLIALGRAEAFTWLAEELGDGELLTEVRALLRQLAQEDMETVKEAIDWMEQEVQPCE